VQRKVEIIRNYVSEQRRVHNWLDAETLCLCFLLQQPSQSLLWQQQGYCEWRHLLSSAAKRTSVYLYQLLCYLPLQ